MGRSKKKQQGKTMAEVGQSSESKRQQVIESENKQQELMESENKQLDHIDESYEWYAEWPQLEKLLIDHLSFRSEEQLDSSGAQPPPEKEAADVSILVPDYGNSKLSENLYDAGFKNIMNLDSSEDVIREMLKRNLRVRPEMKWRVMNKANMQFADETFYAIVDKGGLDSLMEPTLGPPVGTLYLTEVKRVLKAGGKYVCITLANHLVLDLLFYLFRFGWKMSLYTIGQEASSTVPKLQTFMVVAEKDSSPAVYAISSFVEQNFFESNSEQYQAHEWLYTSEEGQWLIVESSEASRLLMILLDSSKSDLSMEYIQMDLSPLVMQLEPGDCGEGFQTPYLCAADRVDKREIVNEGSSVLTGRIVVEDVIYEDTIDDDDDYKGCTFRRLIFKRTESLVQSQALLKESNIISTDVGNKEQQASKPQKKGKQRKSDSQSSRCPVSSGEVKVVHNHLVSKYHSGIVFGIRLIASYLKVSTSTKDLVKTVVIGLGGGLLPMFMKNYLPFLKIEVVELDRKILHIAREYFGFSNNESLKVHIIDGVKFVKEKADGNSSCKVDILVIDVHSSDTSSALTSPAADFIDESFLLNAKDSLSEQGLFIINLVVGSSALKDAVYSRLKKSFSCILSLPIKESSAFNEVLFALKTTGFPIKEDQLSEVCNEFAKSLEHKKKQIEKEVGLLKSIKLLN